jgi:hypothetical protein
MTAGPVPHEDTTFAVTHDFDGKGALLRQSTPDRLSTATSHAAGPLTWTDRHAAIAA